MIKVRTKHCKGRVCLNRSTYWRGFGVIKGSRGCITEHCTAQCSARPGPQRSPCDDLCLDLLRISLLDHELKGHIFESVTSIFLAVFSIDQGD